MMIQEESRLLAAIRQHWRAIAMARRSLTVDTAKHEPLAASIDALSAWMGDAASASYWQRLPRDSSVHRWARRLREETTGAIAELEKRLATHYLDQFRSTDRYLGCLNAAVRMELAAAGIDRHARLMFVGTGALPTTALLLARETGATILCLDIDAAAVRLARRVVGDHGLDRQIILSDTPLAEHPEVARASHFLIASLVPDKPRLIAAIRRRMQPEAKLLLRYGNGFKSLFNHPLDLDVLGGWRVTPILLPRTYYDAVLLSRSPAAA